MKRSRFCLGFPMMGYILPANFRYSEEVRVSLGFPMMGYILVLDLAS